MLTSEGGRQQATLSGGMTSPVEMQQQADEQDSQFEIDLPQESHLLPDTLTAMEQGSEPQQQPQLIPITVNETSEGEALR